MKPGLTTIARTRPSANSGDAIASRYKEQPNHRSTNKPDLKNGLPLWLRQLGFALLALSVTLAFLFRDSLFVYENVLFSNDGPLGAVMAEQSRVPAAFTGVWVSLNWLGAAHPAHALDVSGLIRWLLPVLVVAKAYAPIALSVLGACVWLGSKLHGFSPTTCLAVALAAALNSDFFATACWGVCAQPIAFGLAFLAVGFLSRPEWRFCILAGAATGLCVSQAYDLGALFSVFIGGYCVVSGLVQRLDWWRLMARLGVVMVAAGLVAAPTLATLLKTQVSGVAAPGDGWKFATQYSIPKAEALAIVIPGLYGFRANSSGAEVYRGRAGSDASWDEVVATNGRTGHPSGPFRAGGGSSYAGVMVICFACLAVVLCRCGCRGTRALIGFWVLVLIGALLLMFGRFAPFYEWFYRLPGASLMRNPAKFLHVVQWALLFLFAYGLEFSVKKKVNGRLVACWAFIVIGMAGGAALIYAARQPQLTQAITDLERLQFLGQPVNESALQDHARGLAAVSVQGVWRSFVALVFCLAALALPVRKLAALVPALVVLDLAPIASKWVVVENWVAQYRSNPIIEILKEQPHEQRVALLRPHWFFERVETRAWNDHLTLAGIYDGAWNQRLFPYYNIQTLDVVQESRVAQDKVDYESSLAGDPLRRLFLTNTRYVIGTSELLTALKFKILARFDAENNFATNATGRFALAEVPARARVEMENGSARIIRHRPKQVTIAVTNTAPGVLLLNDRYDADWHATVDGSPVTVQRREQIMRGVAIATPGEHMVQMEYRPNRFWLWIGISAEIASLGVFLVSLRKSAT